MTAVDPIALQVTTGALRAACDEMGAVLVRSAHSANIKERRDCSTALFDPQGAMVMQAEHIPVHLGAMPAAVAAVLREDHAPGRSWILNDPYRGGTHLPDITVITPAFTARGALLGGSTPGATPPVPTLGKSSGSVMASSRAPLICSRREPSMTLSTTRRVAAARRLNPARTRKSMVGAERR